MKKFIYKELAHDMEKINDLGSNGWKIINVFGPTVIMEYECEIEESDEEDLMPLEKTIKDPEALYKCLDKVKRYDWGNHYESTDFITIDEYMEGDFYSDDGEYEMYLSDGFYFVGTNIASLGETEFDEFLKKNKGKFKDPENLKIYYIDYPEDK